MSCHITQFLRSKGRIVVLTGAGLSLNSGIPTYRNGAGQWLRNDPIQHNDFLNKESARQRYWARSYAGWPAVRNATPNKAHEYLVQLEAQEKISLLVTQNVDRLHQRAGHQRVIDLHGRLDKVICLSCGQKSPRSIMQERIQALNSWLPRCDTIAPDGDADVPDGVVELFHVPDCESCGGILKPDVVFFGDSVPREIVLEIYKKIDESDALLVVGSSLMVFSGFRFCRYAVGKKIPVGCINPGKTRADELFSLKVEERCESVLERVVIALSKQD